MIVYDKKRCGEFAYERIASMRHTGFWNDYEAFGWEQNGELQAAVIFNLYSGADIAMHIAAVPGRTWLRREFLYAAFAYPFVQLNVRRISGYVPAKSVDVIEFDEHLGFKREGLMREALPDDDIVCLGMLRKECRFIRPQQLRKAA